jgi:hypothetical protein
MNDDDLRDLFAAFAMINCIGHGGSYEDDAAACYEAADAMIAAKYAKPDGGIATIPKRKYVRKERQ